MSHLPQPVLPRSSCASATVAMPRIRAGPHRCQAHTPVTVSNMVVRKPVTPSHAHRTPGLATGWAPGSPAAASPETATRETGDKLGQGRPSPPSPGEPVRERSAHLADADPQNDDHADEGPRGSPTSMGTGLAHAPTIMTPLFPVIHLTVPTRPWGTGGTNKSGIPA